MYMKNKSEMENNIHSIQSNTFTKKAKKKIEIKIKNKIKNIVNNAHVLV